MNRTAGEKTIAVIGTLDTKGDETEYLRNLIAEKGYHVIVVDVGVMGEIPFEPDICRAEVAAASGCELSAIVMLADECKAIEKMTLGTCKLVRELYAAGSIDGIIALGGSMGTSLALEVMRSLPLGIPKVILSTIAYSEMILPDYLDTDIIMIPWVAGLWGMNRLSEESLKMAAGTIASAAECAASSKKSGNPLVAVTSAGQRVHRFMTELKPALVRRGYEVAVFHSAGMSGRMLERAIGDGLITAVLDLTVGCELIPEVTGGIGSGGAFRLEAAGRMGIPQIVSPGTIEAFGWWRSGIPLPEKYQSRPQRPHNQLINVLLSTIEERRAVGRLMAQKLNKAVGPTVVVIPMEGFGHDNIPDSFGGGEEDLACQFLRGVCDSRDGLVAFREELEKNLRPEIRVVSLENVGINDPAYVEVLLNLFDEMVD